MNDNKVNEVLRITRKGEFNLVNQMLKDASRVKMFYLETPEESFRKVILKLKRLGYNYEDTDLKYYIPKPQVGKNKLNVIIVDVDNKTITHGIASNLSDLIRDYFSINHVLKVMYIE